MAANNDDLRLDEVLDQFGGLAREVAQQAEVIGGMRTYIVNLEYEIAKWKARLSGNDEILEKLEQMEKYLGIFTKATGAALSQQAATFKAMTGNK